MGFKQSCFDNWHSMTGYALWAKADFLFPIRSPSSHHLFAFQFGCVERFALQSRTSWYNVCRCRAGLQQIFGIE